MGEGGEDPAPHTPYRGCSGEAALRRLDLQPPRSRAFPPASGHARRGTACGAHGAGAQTSQQPESWYGPARPACRPRTSWPLEMKWKRQHLGSGAGCSAPQLPRTFLQLGAARLPLAPPSPRCARRLEEQPPPLASGARPPSSAQGWAGEGDEAPEGQGEGVEHLGPRPARRLAWPAPDLHRTEASAARHGVGAQAGRQGRDREPGAGAAEATVELEGK